jgi:AraC-like DNA-binding protein
MNTKIDTLVEITPLGERDCFFVVERMKSQFNFPLHTHKEFEINYVENAANAIRTVGDSNELIGDYDLVLIANDKLQHCWQNGSCNSNKIREITIQFRSDLLPKSLLDKNQFQSINKLFELAKNGVAFPLVTVIKVRSMLNALSQEKNRFYALINLISLLYEMSKSPDLRVLASTSFAQTEHTVESLSINRVVKYLEKNYSNDIKTNDVANLISMTPESFNRFFKKSTGKNLIDYLTDIRIGQVERQLINSTKTVAEISYECGFKNMSNFNRIFKRKKLCSPSEFRNSHGKKTALF